jgi:hypothetical protein
LSDLSRRLLLTGGIYLTSTFTLVISQTPLGSPLFFLCVGLAAVAYLVMLRGIWNVPEATPRLLLMAFLLAVAFRVPLAVAPVGADSDMVRYRWDGRVQLFGYNPYLVVPSDPSVAHMHTDETRRMPSLRVRTPYPPGAQLFFRLVVSIRDSTRAMRLALVTCDILTILVLWQWLVATGRSPWLALAYAWNPLVVLEVAHSGHIDALGALWITASAYFLARRRTALAAATLVLAIATKLLPIVLAPLYWRRIRWRDALLGVGLLTALYVPFVERGEVPLGAVPNVVAYIRFNGPIFRAIAAAVSPGVAAGIAVLFGLAAAVWARRRLDAGDPAAWGWPMAFSLACAPVIYPWYLLYLTPFLWSRATVPLLAWTLSTLPVYVVWDRARHGGRWLVPPAIEAVEFGIVLLSAGVVAFLSHRWLSRSGDTMDELR